MKNNLLFKALSCGLLTACLVLFSGCQCDKDLLMDNTWVLEKYGPASALTEVLDPADVMPPGRPEILLTLSDTSRFSGNDGCNLIFGDYSLSSWCRINFGNINSTLMYCQDSLIRKQASAYTSIIRNVNNFKVSSTALELKTGSNELLLYRKQ
jgi:heat shock protein HslJ